MPNLRAEIQRKSSSAFLQYGLLRLESALVVAGAILLAVFLPNPFPWWQGWMWLVLGALGWIAVVYASLTDPQTSAKVLHQLLREQLDLKEIQDPQLRERVDAMFGYIRSAELDLYGMRASPHLPALERVAEQMYDWVEQGYLLARYVDTYQRDHRLEARRQQLPGAIESLVARLKYEKDPDIIQRLNSEMEALERDWQSLKLLEAQIQTAPPQLAGSLTALARVASEMHVIAMERGLGEAHIDHLQQDIERHLGQITDLVTQVEQLYNDALDKG
ncbi:MAG: hypothetical protein ACP5JG_11250 [Anaerolineae bacterium]